MKEFFEKLSDMQKGMVLSIAVHIFLILLFLIFQSGLHLPDTEFAEIGFVSASSGGQFQPRRQAPSQPAPQPPPELEPAEPAPAEPEQETVNIPKRRMMEDEEPQLNRRDSEKLSPTDESTATGRSTYQGASGDKEIAERPSSGVGEKEFSRPQSGSRGAQTPASGGSSRGGQGSNTPYSIEGDAAERSVQSRVLPQYPSGLQREAVVKIRFTVLPDGRVGTMIPIQKGDPTLERITMDALRQWRFNPLAADVPQKTVQGTITFVYKLE